MHDSWLVAIAMAVSALGIVGLLIALLFIELPLSSIDDARAADDTVPLRIKGTVESVQERGNITVITISQPATLDVIVFGTDLSSGIDKGGCVIVQGKKSTYQGSAQVAATRIARC